MWSSRAHTIEVKDRDGQWERGMWWCVGVWYVVVCLHVVGYVSHKTMNVLCGEGLFK